ncbi:hypothetical protein KUTeg_004723 [Tegillarca granosa]|uniref:SH2 domain-containing protein n=1 Tax=Tegillarca granosa TaxID=220873 RepID=A0ABQ9FHR4_TEGGR|nr:hypothetical protein KUTeg_004723 [Tegillarca granosa]
MINVGFFFFSKDKAEEVDEVDDDTYWESIYFRDSNNEKGNEIIRHIAEDGVYLVREGATGGHVLVVFANNMPKKYRVQQSDNQYFLGRDGPHCDSLEELLYEYYSQNLPTVNVKLNTPYKLHQNICDKHMIKSILLQTQNKI